MLQVWAAQLSTVSGDHERKLAAVGTTKVGSHGFLPISDAVNVVLEWPHLDGRNAFSNTAVVTGITAHHFTSPHARLGF